MKKCSIARKEEKSTQTVTERIKKESNWLQGSKLRKGLLLKTGNEKKFQILC